MVLRREDKIRFEVIAWLEDSANWNKRIENAPVVLGKQLAIVALDDQHSWCLTDADLLEIIKYHVIADKLNVKAIKAGRAGLVKYPELMFEVKVKDLFNKLNAADNIEGCIK